MYLVKKTSKSFLYGKPYITLVYNSKIKPYRVLCCVGNNMSTKHIIYYIIPTRRKLRADPEYSSTRQM